MPRSRINPLSILFVLGLLAYGVYTGVIHYRLPDVGVTLPLGEDDERTVPVSTLPPRGGQPRGTSPTVPASGTVEPGAVLTGEVTKVFDGDTLELVTRESGATYRLRLDGIDAPEEGQPFARESRDQLTQLCLRQTVYVMVVGRDRYERVVGDVYCHDRWVNGELVKAGLAWWYQKYSQSTELEMLERTARQQGLGLWADAHPVPPWDFRHASSR